MGGTRRAGILLAIAAILSVAPVAETAVPTSPEGIGPAQFIAARQALMLAAEELMQPIDTFTVDDSVDQDLIRTNANAIAAMLLAVPQLFPESTNLYDPEAESPVTLALPPIWENFQAFYGLATAASDAATSLSQTFDAAALKNASLALRASCDTCHAVNLLPYEEPEFPQDDDFDFDSLFEN